ncbi:MAG: non-ribosomal peptide synthetase, partial [Chloroflexi bacterium]|nr:non-ribosomal peptide synthetase [Chloroflexota bacterium]
PAPDMTRPELAEAYAAPRTPTEELLCRIWEQVLGLDAVGIHDNFFNLGGASIQSLEVIAKAREMGLHLSIEMLFEHQTVAELAVVVGHIHTDVEQEQQAAPALAAVQHLPQPARADQSNTLIESLGVYLPPKVVSTTELLEHCKQPIRFPLAQLTGINTRRMAGETEFALDLAKKAIAACLANSKYKPEDIDLLISASISRCNGPLQFAFEPNNSVQLRHHFGFTNALAFDVSNACTGLFTAIYLADAFLKAGLIRRALVVSGEYITHLIQTAQKEIETYMDSRLACLTVGDAGAALILERSPRKEIGFHEFEMYTLGRYWDYCIAKATEQEHGGAIMYTDAVKVSAVNMQQAVSHAAHIVERSGWPYDAFQHLLIHQTSKTTIQDAPREINRYFGKEIYQAETVINNIAERGNTATTTQMVTLMDHIRLNTIKSGENVIFGITGSGATIGTALYTFDDLPDRLRRIESGAYAPEKVASEQTRVIPLLSPTQRVRVESIGTPPADVQRETMELVRAAAEHCLAQSSYERSAIDLLIYAGIYRDEFLCEPSLASMVAGMLNINDTIESQHDKKTFALDLFNGAIGFLNACYTAISMIKVGKVKNAMIVASEIENNRVTTLPTELRHIEEDGSCVILDESPDGKTGFGNFVFKYFTDYIESFGAYTVLHKGKMCMHFEQDPHLETYYLRCIQESVDELLRIEQLDITQIKIVLPPQISSGFIARLGNTLNFPIDTLVDMHRENDLFTSSLPYALQYIREQRLVQSGDVGLLISVATGIQVGCATYYF